ncbi:SDR family NAD(P)-dependent oxidoreductase [Ascidiimonas sp. W6]|uniref:SDR family NAD(P)-dependent oxidoreductase n=1 Tax=Ascidiimonas meishanensis TaxID=3128903 RepID=UPI0030EC3019
MKKILVTGADGFIGSHITETLLKNGLDVTAFCLYNSFGTRGWLDTLPEVLLKNATVVMGNICDANTLTKAIKGCDTVIHLAAQVSIPYSYEATSLFVDTNIKGTLNVLEAARTAQVNHILVASSSEVYGTALHVPINERHPLQPQSPYAATKIAADALATSFYKSFGLPVTIFRPFNTYGPRQSARAVIPAVITQLLAGTKTLKLGNLKPTRDFLYIEDTVAAILKIAAQPTLAGQTFNICSGTEISIKELATQLIQKIKPDTQLLEDAQRLRPENSEVYRLYGDASFLKTKTNWKPVYDLDKGLDKTVQWFSKPENSNRYSKRFEI